MIASRIALITLAVALVSALAAAVRAEDRESTSFHVAPTGSDGNDGSRAAPFASLERARDAIRALRRGAGVPPGGVTVWIHGGVYSLARAVAFSREDSGTAEAPIVYAAVPGERVRITGGRAVEGLRPVTDERVLSRLDPTARGKVLEADLKACGIEDFGEVTQRGKRLEVFWRDEPLELARWPNAGFARVARVVGGEPFTSHGIAGVREGKFTYEGDRPRRWTEEPDAWLHGYWFWDWSDSYEKIAAIDVEARTIATVPPYHHYGYRDGQRYYALNLLAELDRPGEWYLDRGTGTLYVWPPAESSDAATDAAPVAEGAPAVVSVAAELFTLRDCSHVTLRGLVLESCRGTAVVIEGGESTRVVGCTVRNTGSIGVRVAGGREHTVLSCDVYRTGEGCLSLSGGDRRTLTPSGHRAENNHLHHFGRLYRTYRPAVGVGGVGQHVAHNRMHDGPHNAIQLGGNDHVIEFNEIHDVCTETGDVGAFYMGRDWTARGTVIRHNYFHDIHGPGLHGAMAVYLDDAASGITIKGNVFVRAARAMFIGGGRDNVVENNVFIDCAASVHVDARGVGWMRSTVETTLPERLAAMPYREPPWSERYPELVNVLDDGPGLPKGNVVRRNISIGGKWLDVEKIALPLIAFEDNIVDGDSGLVDPANLDLRLRPDAPARAAGFEPLPLERFGLYRDEHRTGAVASPLTPPPPQESRIDRS